MHLAIIGTGNVGSALAENLADKGYHIHLGVRDTANFKGRDLTNHENITSHTIGEAVRLSEVIVIAAPPQHALSIIEAMGNVHGKVIIDATNSLRTHPEGYRNAFEALRKLALGAEVVKCFNTTGHENMRDPVYGDHGIDMFMAGDSKKAKGIAKQLALDAGFNVCHDFGGDDKVSLLEQLAFSWINLAVVQGEGRNIGFRVVRRQG